MLPRFAWNDRFGRFGRFERFAGCLALLALGLLPLQPLEAQAPSSDDPDSAIGWLSLGLGGASTGLAGGAAVSVRGVGGLVSLRWVGSGPFDPLGPGTGKELSEVALTYGRGVASERGWRSVGIGVGVLWGSEKRMMGGWVPEEEPISPTPGLALEGQLNFQPTESLGGGLLVFGSVNGESPMGGVLITLQVGRLRQTRDRRAVGRGSA